MKKGILTIVGLICIGLGVWFFLGRRGVSTSKDTIIVGTNAEYPPFTYVEQDTVVGFDIDIIKEVVKRLGKNITIKDMPFDVLIPEIQRGSIQVIAAGMTPTPEREKELRFTACYFAGDPLVIVSRKNNPLTTVEALHGKDVIVNEGYTADFYMSNIQGVNLKRLPAPAASFLALQAGRADAYVSARSIVAPFFKQYGTEKFVITPIEKTEECYALAVSPRYAELVAPINGILEAMKKDGTIQQLKTKWDVQ